MIERARLGSQGKKEKFRELGDVVELQEKLSSGSESDLMVGEKPLPRQTRPAVAGRLHQVPSQGRSETWCQPPGS